MVDPLLMIITLIFGLCIGSFLNVIILRVPDSKSIVSPGSMCPKCGHPIRFYDNIPVLSFLWLRGRCRHCRASISLRYPLVEMLSGLLALSILVKFGPTLPSLIYFCFTAILVVITFIDIDHWIIPDIITLPGIPICFLLSFALPHTSYKDSLLGFLFGGGILYAIGYFYTLATGREGMGGGDIKLLALIGTLLGWQGVIVTIYISSFTGTLVGVAVMLITRKGMKLPIPFGPFLALGATVHIFYHPELQILYGPYKQLVLLLIHKLF